MMSDDGFDPKKLDLDQILSFAKAVTGVEVEAPRYNTADASVLFDDASRPTEVDNDFDFKADIELMRGAFERMKAGNMFKPGDVVTPRPGFNLRDCGTPNLVLEIFERGSRIPSNESDTMPSSNPDMRIARVIHGISDEGPTMLTFNAESQYYEFYVEEKSKDGGTVI
jgi:hypothetical protein